MGIKKKHTNEYKAKVALAALRGDRTLSEIRSEYGVHLIQIGLWKKKMIEGSPRLFETGGTSMSVDNGQKSLIDGLYRKIGEVGIENDRMNHCLPSVKYENICPRGYQTMAEAKEGLRDYFQFYNNERFHQAQKYRTPKQVYLGNTN